MRTNLRLTNEKILKLFAIIFQNLECCLVLKLWKFIKEIAECCLTFLCNAIFTLLVTGYFKGDLICSIRWSLYLFRNDVGWGVFMLQQRAHKHLLCFSKGNLQQTTPKFVIAQRSYKGRYGKSLHGLFAYVWNDPPDLSLVMPTLVHWAFPPILFPSTVYRLCFRSKDNFSPSGECSCKEHHWQ